MNSACPVMSGASLSATPSDAADRLADIERRRVIHRITQGALSTAALTTERHYRRILRNPQGASSVLIGRLEVTLRGIAAAEARLQKSKPIAALLPATYGGFFVLAAQHYGDCPTDVRARLTPGEEKPADPAWRRASHVRQAALYLVNSALAVSQAELAQLVGVSPAAVCLGLRQVEDRRDDPAFDAFLERAQRHVLGV